MAALALLGGVIVFCLAFFRTEAGQGRLLHERYAALLLAESEIERLRTLPYAGIPLGTDQPLTLTLPSAGQLKDSRARLSVTEIEPGIKRGTVTVAWLSRGRFPYRVELTREFAAEELPP